MKMMKSSDGLAIDSSPEQESIQDTELKMMADDYLNKLRMQQMIQHWNGVRTRKHHKARAERAKARIAKRKNKR